jgi:hypothetical protein
MVHEILSSIFILIRVSKKQFFTLVYLSNMHSSVSGILGLSFLLLQNVKPIFAEPEVLLPLASWDQNAAWGTKRTTNGLGENLDLRNDEHLMWGNPGSKSLKHIQIF